LRQKCGACITDDYLLVWAFFAFRLTSMARTPKRRIWTVAPDAYQKGPEMPYW
jgi:hypothetical protein